MLLDDFQAWRNEVLFLLNRREYRLKKEGEIFLSRMEGWPSGETPKGEVPLYEIRDYLYLVRLIGEFKSHFSDRNIRILLRGQRNAHSFLQYPSIFRIPILYEIVNQNWRIDQKKSAWNVLSNRHQELANYSGSNFNLSGFKKSLDRNIKYFNRAQTIWEGVPNMLVFEPILQHYGYEGHWLDLVDSIPIALWFASQNPNDEWPENEMCLQTSDYGYLFIYGVLTEKQIAKGVWESDTQRLVNLAEATTPNALRPHIQYAYSMLDKSLFSHDFVSIRSQKKLFSTLSLLEYSKFLLCVIKIPSLKILEWIGAKGKTGKRFLPNAFKYENLFPSPRFDSFYKKLYLFEKNNEYFLTKKIKAYHYNEEDFLRE